MLSVHSGLLELLGDSLMVDVLNAVSELLCGAEIRANSLALHQQRFRVLNFSVTVQEWSRDLVHSAYTDLFVPQFGEFSLSGEQLGLYMRQQVLFGR